MTYLVTVKKHEYDGTTYKPGDRYHLDDYYARQLIHLGVCSEAGLSCPTAVGEPGPEGPPGIGPLRATDPPTETGKAKRQYNRRDMRPEK